MRRLGRWGFSASWGKFLQAGIRKSASPLLKGLIVIEGRNCAAPCLTHFAEWLRPSVPTRAIAECLFTEYVPTLPATRSCPPDSGLLHFFGRLEALGWFAGIPHTSIGGFGRNGMSEDHDQTLLFAPPVLFPSQACLFLLGSLGHGNLTCHADAEAESTTRKPGPQVGGTP